MSFMAERPTGALHEDEPDVAEPVPDDSVDTALDADPDADAPAGWDATHFSSGGGVAQDEAGNTVVVDAEGVVTTFPADDTNVGSR